ncbi:hypothetical protein ES332_A01G192900v1 [Gossypium tomentosum]|uniref:Uncharacterized protein n=1 Tax=Gossypium tomentosum TaxID=34277 RepID=A0A5D2RWA8_GOSTO|nr:hypothetical protein ES332_A01G192900v1 [Gossypium tomentosum]
MEYPITGVFHSGLKQRFLGISIPFPLHRLAIRCLKNPILPLQKFHLKTLSIGSHFSYPTPAFLPYQVGAGSFFHIGNARHLGWGRLFLSHWKCQTPLWNISILFQSEGYDLF